MKKQFVSNVTQNHTKSWDICMICTRGESLPLAGIRLSIDPPFCIGISLNLKFVTTLHPMTPYLCFFDQIFPAKSSHFWKILQIAAKISKECVKIARISCNFTPNNPPLFRICHPMTPFFARKSLLKAPLCIGRSTPSLLYVSAPRDVHVRF